MDAIKKLGQVLMSKDFWLHALAVLIGFKLSDFINAIVAEKADFIPDQAAPFVGPAIVIAASPLVGRVAGQSFAAYMVVGAGLNVVDTLLGYIGLDQQSVRTDG